MHVLNSIVEVTLEGHNTGIRVNVTLVRFLQDLSMSDDAGPPWRWFIPKTWVMLCLFPSITHDCRQTIKMVLWGLAGRSVGCRCCPDGDLLVADRYFTVDMCCIIYTICFYILRNYLSIDSWTRYMGSWSSTISLSSTGASSGSSRTSPILGWEWFLGENSKGICVYNMYYYV
jgi:hypothetical protein